MAKERGIGIGTFRNLAITMPHGCLCDIAERYGERSLRCDTMRLLYIYDHGIVQYKSLLPT